MPSEEFKKILELIKSRPDTSGLSFPERRAGMEERLSLLPVAKNVSIESIKIRDLDAEWLLPPEIKNDVIILFFHGGGYCIGSINTHRSMASHLAKTVKAKVLTVEYRLAPESPFPAAVEDATVAYEWLLSTGTNPQKLVIAGDSAGGGLAVATMLNLKTKGMPLPGAAVCFSPWVDMEGIGESFTSKMEVDPIVNEAAIKIMAQSYLAGAGFRNPLAAPLYGDLSGLPPMLIQVGTAEVLLDDSRRLAEKAEQNGVKVELETWEDMVHVFQLYAYMLPESRDALENVAKFIQKTLE